MKFKILPIKLSPGELAAWAIVAIAIVLGLAGPCSGQALFDRSPRPMNPATRITVQHPGGTSSIGSGVFVRWDGQQDLVLTCGHLFTEPIATITVCVGTAGCVPADLLDVDHGLDIAVIKTIPLPPRSHSEMTLAASDAPVGTSLSAYGFGKTGEPGRAVSGRVVTYGWYGNEAKGTVVRVACSTREGDSGGPIYDRNNHLYGVIAASDRTHVSGPTASVIRKFLDRAFDTRLTAVSGVTDENGYVALTIPAEMATQPGSIVIVDGATPHPCDPVQLVPIEDLPDAPLPVPDAPCDCASCPPCPPCPGAGGPCPAGPAGPAGPRGPRGKPGEPGQLTAEHIEAMTAGLLAGLMENEEFILSLTNKVDIGSIADQVRRKIAGEIHYEWTPDTPSGEK